MDSVKILETLDSGYLNQSAKIVGLLLRAKPSQQQGFYGNPYLREGRSALLVSSYERQECYICSRARLESSLLVLSKRRSDAKTNIGGQN